MWDILGIDSALGCKANLSFIFSCFIFCLFLEIVVFVQANLSGIKELSSHRLCVVTTVQLKHTFNNSTKKNYKLQDNWGLTNHMEIK